MLVCAAVLVLRKTNPEMPREFKTPFVPVVPILGILVCGLMILGLGWPNWLRLIVWLLIGFVLYFSYGRKHSLVQKGMTVLPKDPPGNKLTLIFVVNLYGSRSLERLFWLLFDCIACFIFAVSDFLKKLACGKLPRMQIFMDFCSSLTQLKC